MFEISKNMSAEDVLGGKCDIALPLQLKMIEEEAKTLVANGCICVLKG
jgi:hypothetical protein